MALLTSALWPNAAGSMPPPVSARLSWHLHEICHQAFSMVDVDGGGSISADELARPAVDETIILLHPLSLQ